MGRCIKLYLDKTYEDKKFPTKAGVIKDGNDEVGYTPLCVFSERKPRKVFWRGARQLILFVEDALNALHFSKKGIEDLQMAWGKAEAREYLFKIEALAQVSVKPMKMWQFALLILINIIGLVAIIYLNMKLGALGL